MEAGEGVRPPVSSTCRSARGPPRPAPQPDAARKEPWYPTPLWALPSFRVSTYSKASSSRLLDALAVKAAASLQFLCLPPDSSLSGPLSRACFAPALARVHAAALASEKFPCCPRRSRNWL